MIYTENSEAPHVGGMAGCDWDVQRASREEKSGNASRFQAAVYAENHRFRCGPEDCVPGLSSQLTGREKSSLSSLVRSTSRSALYGCSIGMPKWRNITHHHQSRTTLAG